MQQKSEQEREEKYNEVMNPLNIYLHYIRQGITVPNLNTVTTLSYWWLKSMKSRLQEALNTNDYELIKCLWEANFDNSHEGRQMYKQRFEQVIQHAQKDQAKL